MTTPELVEEVEKYFDANPKSSIRRAAQQLQITPSTLYIVMKKFIKIHPYKVSIGQKLKERDMARRVEFSKQVLGMIERDEINPSQIIFSDEAHFHLDGYVNKQNMRIWGKENPNMVISRPAHPIRVTAWAAVTASGIYLTFIEGNVTSNSYKELLANKFLPSAKKKGLISDHYFMQDGATPHRTREVFECLFESFGERVIGLGYPKFTGGGIEWPPYSPDLNPCDFFLWGFLKDRAYVDAPKNSDELKKAIEKAKKLIKADMLERVFHSFVTRLEIIERNGGGHFENVYS